MKTKFFFFLTMLLMSSVGVFAQSETNTPLKGDLNEDGKVDAADIVVLVDLVMKNGGEAGGDVIYYWYAGTILPSESNISSIATGSETSKPNWTADNQQDITATNNTGESAYMYYCFPSDWNVEFYDSNGFNIGIVSESSFTYNGVNYKVERLGRKQAAGATIPLYARCGDNSQDPEPTYYWYAGTTLPSESNISSIATGSATSKPNWTAVNQQDCTATNNTGESSYIYYCFPTTWNVEFYDENGFNVGLAFVSNFTYNGIEYKVERLGRKQAAGATIPLYARCDKDIFYWYIGVDNPSYISNIQTDNTVPGWHEIGSSLSGFTLDTNTNSIHISEERVQYYVIIPNNLHIYNGLNMNIENVTFEAVTCNISGYKAFKYLPSGGSTGVRDVTGIIIKSDNIDSNKYYWYIGVDNPSSISNLQTDNTKPGWHEIGTSLSGFMLNTDTNVIDLGTPTRVIYNVIIPEGLHIYAADGTTNVESLYFNSIESNIPGYKAFKEIPSEYYPEGDWEVCGIIIK